MVFTPEKPATSKLTANSEMVYFEFILKQGGFLIHKLRVASGRNVRIG